MDIITTLRDLWRHRLPVAGILLVALAAGTMVAYKVSFPPKLESRSYDVGVATAHLLVDSPSSQIVNIAPRGVATLGVATQLLASLMVDGPIKNEIATQAGLQPNQLVGTTDAATVPSTTSPASPAPTTSRKSYVLSTQVLTNPAGNDLPIIALNVQAPNQAAATRLVTASIAGVHAYLGTTASQERVARQNLLQVTGLDSTQAQTVTRGPSKLLALIVSLGVFLFGCAGLLTVLAIVRGWRAASIREQLSLDPASVLDLLPTRVEPRLKGGNVVIDDRGNEGPWAWPGAEPARKTVPARNGDANKLAPVQASAVKATTAPEPGPQDEPVEAEDAQMRISALLELLGGSRPSADPT